MQYLEQFLSKMTVKVKLPDKIVTYFSHPDKAMPALVHRSYLNESSLYPVSNERLEFLGDAVIELWTSEKIYTLFPHFSEGKLTNLRSLIVRTESLAAVSTGLDLGKYLLLSRGEEKSGGRENTALLANTFEALIGALYLDGGFSAIDKFLTRFFLPQIKKQSAKKELKDPKSLFQEKAQEYYSSTPIYKILSTTGPEHKKYFVCGVFLAQHMLAEGTGHSKQEAEEHAAKNALKSFAKIKLPKVTKY